MPSAGAFETCNAKKLCFSVVANKSQQKFLWMPSMGVFELCNAKKCVFLVWHAMHLHHNCQYKSSLNNFFL